MRYIFLFFCFITFLNCKTTSSDQLVSKKDFIWEGANIYFLLTDRFNNGDTSNDINFNRTEETGVLRGFEGGDIKGITQKVKEGYFTDLGINAIWMTPIVEQIHGATDEGTGNTYGYHGYWAKDWTKIDPNFGTKQDLKELVDESHKRGIRILLDAVINHTGPVTEKDPVWPISWVRTEPRCEYKNYETTITCTLVENLPDIRTDSNENVELPPHLVEKWKSEGRYEQEVKELEAYFKRTGYPRAPRFYIMKWLTDYITDFGIDGYRVDTVKHTEEYVWQEFKKECDYAFEQFKLKNPEKILDDNNFYLVGEVYNYAISNAKAFNFGDKTVNYFEDSFNSLINFEIKWNAKQMNLSDLFVKYDSILNNELDGFGVLNYMTSHDDGNPFDGYRNKPFETAEILLLTPGASQVYYGDELARKLLIDGAKGDANLRSFMNWESIKNETTKNVLSHWQKLGQFRASHMSIGAGKHNKINSEKGIVFSRTLKKDKVIVGLNLPLEEKIINVSSIFEENQILFDFYSKQKLKVTNGKVYIQSEFSTVLLEQ